VKPDLHRFTHIIVTIGFKLTDLHKETASGQNSVTDASALQKVFSGVRKPIGVRVDTGLYSAVKPVLLAKYGSICRPIEAFLVAHLAIAVDPASTSNTVKIENLWIQRNLRSRRKLAVKEGFGLCGFKGCGALAVASGVWLPRKEEYALCKKHRLEAQSNPGQWEFSGDRPHE